MKLILYFTGSNKRLGLNNSIKYFNMSGFDCEDMGNGYLKVDTHSPRSLNDRSGISWIDMKPFFAMSRKAHHTDHGWYLNVPIQPSENKLSVLDKPQLDLVNNLQEGQTISVPQLEKLTNSGYTNVTGAINNNAYNQNGLISSTDIQPTLFRRVSNNSSPGSWITVDKSRADDVKHIVVNTDDLQTPESIIIQNQEDINNNPSTKALSTNTVKNYLNQQSFDTGDLEDSYSRVIQDREDLNNNSSTKTMTTNTVKNYLDQQSFNTGINFGGNDRSVPNQPSHFEQETFPGMEFNDPPTR